jgi:circadian clock protein KaiC
LSVLERLVGARCSQEDDQIYTHSAIRRARESFNRQRRLDDILGGGLEADRVYLLEGRPGTGKTTLAPQFLIEGARRGDRCLYVTLSESERELRAVAAGHGWNLDGIDVFELVPAEASLDPEQELTPFHPAEMELGETVKRILDRVVEVNPKRVVFDSLSEMRLLAQSSLRYRWQILALKILWGPAFGRV